MNKQTILIVDDEKCFVQAVKTYLLEKSNKYRIKTAYNGEKALKFLEKEKVDLVILDINMPIMDGIQFLSELHNRRIWMPVIILSQIEKKKAEERGEILTDFDIVEYMGKPVNLEKLDKNVEEVLNHFKKHKESISGIDLKTILRILESEQKTGILTINQGKTEGRIFFRKGEVVDAEFNDLSQKKALAECMKSGDWGKEISVEYINHTREKKITVSLSEMQLDSSRLQNKKTKPKKEKKMNVKKLNQAIEVLKGDVGAGLLATDIYGSEDGQILAGWNSNPQACALFNQITGDMTNALEGAGFPTLGRYYIMDLVDDKMVVVITMGDYQWGLLVDRTKVQLGLLLNVVIPKIIDFFEEAIAS